MVVLDSWALVAYLKDEPAAARVELEWVAGGVAMCSVNLGEVLYMGIRQIGADAAAASVERVRAHMDLIDPDWGLVQAAASIKAEGSLSYADAFCLATAQRLGVPLWTGDPEIVAQAGAVDVADLREA